MAGELGLASLAPQRGWEALRAIGWSIQKPRPRNPKAATPRSRTPSKKSRRSRRRGSRAPPRRADRGVRDRRAPARPEAGDAARLGAGRRAADRARPSSLRMALRTAFVSPATGESFWYVSNGVSKPFFEALLRCSPRKPAPAGTGSIVLVLDNAGWHGEAGLAVPEGLRLALPARLHPRSSAGRNALDAGRRAHRQQAHPHPRNPRRKSSPSDAPQLANDREKMKARPASTGGRKSPTRANHPEME